MFTVIVELVTVAVLDVRISKVPLPASSLDLVTVTDEAESNSNPEGAVRTIVPTLKSLLAPSLTIGPVNGTYAPPVVSADIVEPPVAGVTLTAANATDVGIRSDAILKRVSAIALRAKPANRRFDVVKKIINNINYRLGTYKYEKVSLSESRTMVLHPSGIAR